MDRCTYVREAFARAGVANPSDDQLDTACNQLDALELRHGSIGVTKLKKKDMEAAADEAVAFCSKGGSK